MRTLKFRLRPIWIVVAIVLGLLMLLYPYLTLVTFGLSRNLDVLSMIEHGVRTPVQGDVISESDVPVVNRPVTWRGHLQNPDLNECSGIAVSRRHKDLVWGHNDSGGKPRVFAFNGYGEDLGFIDVDVPEAGDWEDMASFELDGTSYLLLADVGDNYRWRRELYLHVIAEPDMEALQNHQVIKPAWTITYSYPEGYHDVEAVAVDALEGKVYLLSKRTVPQILYSLPLAPQSGPLTAERETAVTGIPLPNAHDLVEDPLYGKYRSQPTAMDMSHNLAVVVTYKDAYLFPRKAGESWASAFKRTPERVELPRVYGREAAALDGAQQQLWVTAERRGAEATSLFRVDLAIPLLDRDGVQR